MFLEGSFFVGGARTSGGTVAVAAIVEVQAVHLAGTRLALQVPEQ